MMTFSRFVVWLNTGNNVYRLMAVAIPVSIALAYVGDAILP